ncbi:hypothetical protein [Beihai picorna-like virus 57]|uniref:hypothetical protein n=1 Tax=Beihai picorna-like virus 57 TaxID=1922602 RepID=UPI00090B91A6|nr:hypothetical protein [Beihai picorna-like virus 57]APG76773.1 hypothetical protein [Beihai picorna-like virus 57]APG76812.1 hypothetical protein [Beihai picorna-like virus 57]
MWSIFPSGGRPETAVWEPPEYLYRLGISLSSRVFTDDEAAAQTEHRYRGSPHLYSYVDMAVYNPTSSSLLSEKHGPLAHPVLSKTMPMTTFSKEGSFEAPPESAPKSSVDETEAPWIKVQRKVKPRKVELPEEKSVSARPKRRKPKPGSKKFQAEKLLEEEEEAPRPSQGARREAVEPPVNAWRLEELEMKRLASHQFNFLPEPQELPDVDPFGLGPIEENEAIYNPQGKLIRQFNELDKDYWNSANVKKLLEEPFSWPRAVVSLMREYDAIRDKPKRESRGVNPLRESRHNWGLDRKRWVAPITPDAPVVARPLRYSIQAYRRWAAGEIWKLQSWLIKQTSAWRKRQYVTGNLAAQYLWDGARPASARERDHMLTKARFYIGDYNAPATKEVPHPRLIDFTRSPNGPLFLKSEELTSEDLDDPVLQKNKPVHRAVSAYLKGSRSIPRDTIQRSIDKLHYQGLFSVDVNVTHEIIFPEVQTILASVGLSEEKARRYVSLASLVVGVFTSTSVLNAGSLFTMYFVNHPVALNYCLDLLKRIPSVTHQGIGSAFRDHVYYPLWEAVASAGVFTLLQEFPSSVADLFVPLIKDMVELTRKGLKKESATAVAKWVITWVTDIFGRIKLCIESKSLAPLWGSKWDPRKWEAYANGYQQYFVQLTIQADASPSTIETVVRLRDEGHIPSHWTRPLTVGEFLLECKDHLEQGKELVSYFSGQPTVSALLRRSIDKLQSFVSATEIQATGVVERVQPIFIYLYGKAGVGKTNVARQLAKAIGRRHGFSIDSDGIYDFQGGGVNFQDGFLHTHWCVIMDDIDQSVAPPVSGVRNHCEEVIALVNNKPYSVEQADVNLKGKVRANPLVIFYCSNFDNGLAQQYLREPHAFWRRITYHVTQTVKKEFSTPDGRLDTEKARLSETHDMFTFKVAKYKPNKQDENVFLGRSQELSINELFKACQEAFKSQLQHQTRLLQVRASLPRACTECGLDTDRRCGCVPVEEPDSSEDEDSLSEQNEDQGLLDLYACLHTRLAIGWASVISPGMVRVLRYLSHVPRALTDPKWMSHRVAEMELTRMQDQLAVGLASVALVGVGIMAVRQLVASVSEDTLQGREANAGIVNLPSNWVRADQTFVPGIPSFGKSTFTKEDAQRAIQDSHCYVSSDAGQSMSAFVFGPSCLLVPTHVLDGATKLSVTQSKSATTIEVPISPHTFALIPSNRQLAVVFAPNLTGVLGISKKMMGGVDESIHSFDEVEIYGLALVYSPTSNAIKMQAGTRVLTTNANTQNGDCGMVYLCRHNQSWKIAGMHYAINATTRAGGTTYCTVAGLTSALEISRVAAQFGQTSAEVRTITQSVSKVPEDVTFGKFGVNSEIWAAQSTGAVVAPLGQLYPPLPGSTMKTKIEDSLFREDLTEMEAEHCGEVGYWRPPVFRGKMEGSTWVSPFTNMFVTQNLANPDIQLMKLALLDYVSGMARLDHSGYAVLSEEQAMAGIPGSYVNGVNMKTSVGPPYCVGKSRHAMVTAEGSWFSDNVAKMCDEIEEVLAEGGIPSVLGLCSLKDEAVKPGKHPRVFICLPFSMNIVLKRYGSPWKSFMRANPEFFESSVGINMTSAECNRIPRHLATVNPELDEVYDGDLKAMDKSWCPAMFEFVSLAVYVMCSLLGTEPDKNRRLILAMRHVTYSVKNDLFRACMNPSGCDATVELNGMCLSLCERYVYYRSHPFTGDWAAVDSWFAGILEKPEPPELEGLTFRRNVALIHYGDDNIKTMRFPPSKDYLKIWKEELGFIMTSASAIKGVLETLVPAKITEVSFLKRMFVWDDELGYYIPPLDMRSITRMLVIKKDSSLTRNDHAATVLTEAHREMVYHGEEAFEAFVATAKELAEKHDLLNNPYFDLKPFAHWREQMAKDTFQTWSLRDNVAPEDCGLNLIFQSMDSLNLAEPPIEAPVVSETFNMTHETGAIMSSAAAQVSASDEQPSVHQTMPRTDLGNFLLRPTYVSQTTLVDTDVPNTIIHDFDPWGLFRTTPFIADKLNNYTYIRGTIQVIAVVTVPGGAYGRYAISALPNAGPKDPTLEISHGLHPENCLQVDHYGLIDGAEAESVVLQLPFAWAYDFGTTDGINSAPVDAMWTISTTCLQPLSTGVTGGLTTGYVKFYANLLDDFEITVPNFQSKKKHQLVANDAMRTHAPKVHAMIGEGKGSAIAGQIATVAEAATKVPVIGAMAATVGQVARGAEMVLDWFGFTRTSEEKAPMPITQRSVTNVAHVDGADSGDTAALSFMNEISIDPRLSGFAGDDCLANADLFQRWTRVASFTWSTDDVPETNLFGMPVSPSYAVENAGSIHMTTAGYYGLPFEYWRGDMEYKVMIPVSKFHRGALQILWISDDNLPGFDVTNAALNLIHEVSSGQDIEFTVGYARERPYLHNRLITAQVPIVPYGVAANGFLVFRIINPLTAQSIATSTTVTIFARAKNMDFTVPRDTLLYTDGVDPVEQDISTTLVLQGALGDDGGVKEEPPFPLVPPSGPFPGDSLYFGESIQSVRALLQKPSRLPEILVAGQEILRSPYLPPVDGNDTVWTWQGHYAPLFLGLAYSERYKIYPKNDSWIGMSRTTYSAAAPATTSTLAPMTFCGPNFGAEFNIPYYTPEKFRLTRDLDAPAYGDSVVRLNVYGRSATAVAVVPYYSYGPDIRATCFRQVPAVSFRTAISVAPWWVY